MSDMTHCRLYYQEDKKENKPYSGADRRKALRKPLSNEAKDIVNELDARISRKIHNIRTCIIPSPLKNNLQHISLAITEVGRGDMPRGINTAKDTIKRSHEFFVNQDQSKKTAVNAAIKWLVPFIFVLLGSGIFYYLLQAKGGR